MKPTEVNYTFYFNFKNEKNEKKCLINSTIF